MISVKLDFIPFITLTIVYIFIFLFDIIFSIDLRVFTKNHKYIKSEMTCNSYQNFVIKLIQNIYVIKN